MYTSFHVIMMYSLLYVAKKVIGILFIRNEKKILTVYANNADENELHDIYAYLLKYIQKSKREM